MIISPFGTGVHRSYTARLLIGALVSSVCSVASAEIVIPNPLIKPQQITPVAEVSGDKSKALALPMPGEAMTLPRLPAAGASLAQGSTAVDADSVRSTLALYQVVMLSYDHAVLKAPSRTAGNATESGPTGGPTAGRKSPSTTLIVRHNGPLKIMGESLRVRIIGDSVEIARVGPKSGGEDIVFFASLEASPSMPYVPDVAKLEKIDTQYLRSLIPEVRSSSSSSSSGSGNNSNSGSQGQSPGSSSQ
jgi:hypothetical protein